MSKVADVLAELRLEEERLTVELGRIRRAIEALEESTNPRSVAAEAVPEQPAPPPPPPAAAPYAHLNLYQAARAYLVSVKSPQTSQQIARALVEGGFLHTRAIRNGTSVHLLHTPSTRDRTSAHKLHTRVHLSWHECGLAAYSSFRSWDESHSDA